METNLVKTNVKYNKEYFDSYQKDYNPLLDSFDFQHHYSFPSYFIDLVRECTKFKNNPSKINDIVFATNYQEFHTQVVSLLMSFGLNFSENDFPYYDLLPTHREAFENKMLLILDKDVEDFDITNDFQYTLSILKNFVKSAIFIFNSNTGLQIYGCDNGYLETSSIVLVYSKQKARVLNPKDFYFCSRKISSKVITPDEKYLKHFLELYKYELIEDHWVPKLCKKGFNKIISTIIQAPTRKDYLSFDFQNIMKSTLKIYGYIGVSLDIFLKVFKEPQTAIQYFKQIQKKYICLDNDYRGNKNPYLLYFRDSGNVAYVFLIFPDSPILKYKENNINGERFSPCSPLYNEVTLHAYHWMKSCCSNVEIIPHVKFNYKEYSSNPGLQSFDELRKILVGGNYKIDDSKKERFTHYLFGGISTSSYVTNQEKKRSKNLNKMRFPSLHHLFQWILWTSRIKAVHFELNSIKNKTIKIDNIEFILPNQNNNQFNTRSKKKISCSISESVFSFLRRYLMKEVPKQYSKTQKKITIKKIIAFEDGFIDVYFDQNLQDNSIVKVYKICETSTKSSISGYFQKMVTLYDFDKEFLIINSWIHDNNVLLLFYFNNKYVLFNLKKGYKDRTPPMPIFEIDANISNHNELNNDIEKCFYILSDNIKYITSYCPKTRQILLITYENEKYQLLSITINSNFSGISSVKRKNLRQFIPLESIDNTNLLFGGFILNENGHDGVISFRCKISNKVAQSPFQKSNNYFHYFVFFNSSNLNVLKTFKCYFKMQNPNIESQKFLNSIQVPLLYMNDYIVSIITNESKNYVLFKCTVDKEKVEIEVNFKNIDNKKADQDFISYFPILKTQFGLRSAYGIPIFQTLQKGRPIPPKVENVFCTPSNHAPWLYNIVSKGKYHIHSAEEILAHHFPNFDGLAISKMIQDTLLNYGISLADQISLPQRNMKPLQLFSPCISYKIITLKPDETIFTENLSNEDVKSICEGLENTDYVHLLTLNDKTYPLPMQTYISPFLFQLFSTPQIVVSKPIVDSVTYFKNKQHFFYNIRSNLFQPFVFLRMTSNCPCAHISGIGNDKISSLISCITGCIFSYIPMNSLSIGFHQVPIISKSFGIMDDYHGIKSEFVQGLFNIIGSVFHIEETTFKLVVGFISSFISSDSIIIQIETPDKIIEFFRKFFDCADLICSDFDITIPDKQVNVIILCDLGNNQDETTKHIMNEIYHLCGERGILNSKTSFALQILQKCHLSYFKPTGNAIQDSEKLYQSKVLNLYNYQSFQENSSKYMKSQDAIPLLKKMSLIFGQQIDYEANFSTIDNTTFIKFDDDNSCSKQLFSLSLNLNEECDTEQKEKSDQLCLMAAEQGCNEAMFLLGSKLLRNDKNSEIGMMYLKNASKNHNLNAQIKLTLHHLQNKLKYEQFLKEFYEHCIDIKFIYGMENSNIKERIQILFHVLIYNNKSIYQRLSYSLQNQMHNQMIEEDIDDENIESFIELFLEKYQIEKYKVLDYQFKNIKEQLRKYYCSTSGRHSLLLECYNAFCRARTYVILDKLFDDFSELNDEDRNSSILIEIANIVVDFSLDYLRSEINSEELYKKSCNLFKWIPKQQRYPNICNRLIANIIHMNKNQLNQKKKKD